MVRFWGKEFLSLTPHLMLSRRPQRDSRLGQSILRTLNKGGPNRGSQKLEGTGNTNRSIGYWAPSPAIRSNREANRSMILQIVKLKTTLSEDELLSIAHERAPEFRAIPGLVQKYYVRRQGEGEYSGVYLWDSMDSLAAFRESDLAKSIPTAYEVVEPPVIEVGEVLFPLRG